MNLDTKPHISYPCQWEYRIIGKNQADIEQLVAQVMPRGYQINKGNTSSKGNFISICVKILVNDEVERNEIFNKLNNSPITKMII